MTIDVSTAGPADLELVLELMREFYRVEHLPYNEEVARRALGELWSDPAPGRLHLLRVHGEPAGYLVLTYGFSLEFHGRDALVDELYVRDRFRGLGVGSAALRRVEEDCRAEGIRALHLEVDRANHDARRLYHRLGYDDHDRYLLTRWLGT